MPIHRRLLRRAFGGEVSGVFRGMAVLATGSGLAKLVGVVSLPIVTRLYAPEDFGVMAVYSALILMLLPFMTLQYALALPLPRHDGAAMNLLVLSVGLMVMSGTVITVLLSLYAQPLLTLLSMEVLAPWWWLITLGLFGAAFYELLTYWATRRRNYRIIARTKVTQSLAGNAVKIGLGLVISGPMGLLAGQLVAKSGGIGTLLRSFLCEFRAGWRHVSWQRLRIAGWRHKGFPIFRMPSQLLLVFSLQAPVIVVAAAFGGATAGQFGLAMTVVALPMGLIGSGVSKALYGEAAKIGSAEPSRLLSLAKATQLRLFVMALLPAGLLDRKSVV